MKKTIVAMFIVCISLLSVFLCFPGCFGKEKKKEDYSKIEIKSTDDLFTMKEGKYYVLTCDIDLQGKNWTPLNIDGFDGQGHTISNININSPKKCDYSANENYYSYSFLGNCRWFENTKFNNVNIVASQEINDDVFISFCVGLGEYIDNVSVDNSSMTQSIKTKYCGGIAGKIHGEIKNCIVKNCKIMASKDITWFGGIVASAEKSMNSQGIKDCLVTNFSSTTNIAATAGGIAGIAWSSDISNCMATNNTLIADLVGGIIGDANGNNNHITGCVSQNNVFSSQYSGGIVDFLRDGTTVANCLSYKNTFIAQNNAGVIGSISGANKGVIRSCLSVQNNFEAAYNKSLKLSSSVANDNGTIRFIGTYQNNFKSADTRNIVKNNEEQEISESNLHSIDTLSDKFKLDRNLWSISEDEMPNIKNNFTLEEK